jgi:Lipase
LNLQTFEVVGFSIGAQFGGYIGRKVKSKSAGNFTLPRIVGLEPGKLSPVNLGPSDAAFVMTMHTGNFASEPNVIGHVAFWPNGGIDQPMCKKIMFFIPYFDVTCSHGQAQLFWIEAVITKSATVFPARKCNSFADFTSLVCNQTTPLGYMNTQTSNLLRGNYYLTTNNFSPYTKATA